MFEKLESIKKKYEELNKTVSNPSKDYREIQEAIIEIAKIKPIVLKYEEYLDTLSLIEDEKEMLGEIDDKSLKKFKELVKEDIKDLSDKKDMLVKELKILLLPEDINDKKNVIVEIRAGVGGDEAGIFAEELLKMYLKYAEKQRWKSELLTVSRSKSNCLKEAVILIKGKGAYSKLKYEIGVHRVQRVPETETKGRLHTSSATVAVLPEADDIEVKINEKDIRVDTFRSSGNGGQYVNTTDSAVRITHFPTGIVISCQDEKSQTENKAKAMKILKAKIYDLYLKEQNAEISGKRKSQIGSGDRSEKIRTYNFPKSRVTDHRVDYTSYSLESFMDGDIDKVIEILAAHEQAKKIAEL
jgi:peptide chain release factor 1